MGFAGALPVLRRYDTSSDRARRDVDHQSQQRRVEHEGDDAVYGGGAADDLVGDADVGDLRCHADDEGEINKVPVVGLLPVVAARELQAARFAAAIVVMRV